MAHKCATYQNTRGELIDPADQGGIGCKVCYPPSGRVTEANMGTAMDEIARLATAPTVPSPPTCLCCIYAA